MRRNSSTDSRSFSFNNDRFGNLPWPHERRDLVFKFLVIGEYGVGKTAIVKRYTEGKFSSKYKITVGADFCVRSFMWDAKTRVNLQMWDIAGHERFSYMTRVYYKHAIGCIVVFDVTRYTSFKAVTRWVTDLNDKVMWDDGRPVPVVLFANKSDIGEDCISDEAVNKLCRELGICAWFKTSAKSNLNIDEGVSKLVQEALNLVTPEEPPYASPKDSIQLTEQEPDKDGCCN